MYCDKYILKIYTLNDYQFPTLEGFKHGTQAFKLLWTSNQFIHLTKLHESYFVDSNLSYEATLSNIYGILDVGICSIFIGISKVSEFTLGSTQVGDICRIESIKAVALPKDCAIADYKTDSFNKNRTVNNTATSDTVKTYISMIHAFFSNKENYLYYSLHINLTRPLYHSLTSEQRISNTTPISEHIDACTHDTIENSSNTHSSSNSSVQWKFSSKDQLSQLDTSEDIFIPKSKHRESYHWNNQLFYLMPLNIHHMFSPVIKGYVSCLTLPVQLNNYTDVVLYVLLICRQSSKHVGTRYFARGLAKVSEFKHLYAAANASEVEQVVFMSYKINGDTLITPVQSYCILRGSCPLTWGQRPDYTLKPRPVIYNDNQLERFSGYINYVKDQHEFGHIYCIDLLDSTNPKEKKLREVYASVVKDYNSTSSGEPSIEYTTFNFNLNLRELKKANNSVISQDVASSMKSRFMSSIPQDSHYYASSTFHISKSIQQVTHQVNIFSG